MVDNDSMTLPTGITRDALTSLLRDIHGRQVLLQAVIGRFEERYTIPLEALETRLARGEGEEHPDWEDSIEWRNATESLHRAHVTERLLEWLLNLTAPSPNSSLVASM